MKRKNALNWSRRKRNYFTKLRSFRVVALKKVATVSELAASQIKNKQRPVFYSRLQHYNLVGGASRAVAG